MNPLIGELKNVLTAGKVIGEISDPSFYRNDDRPRGEPWFVMGRSSLMDFAFCPERWRNGYTSEETKATEWGDLIDCLVTTPWEFKNRYAVLPAVYPSDGMQCPKCGSVTSAKSCRKCGVERVKVVVDKPWDKNATYCAEWEESHSPNKCIKSALFGSACDAVKVFEKNAEINALVECSKRQVMATASYQDEETGITVPLKILIDLLPDKDSQWGKAIVDLKTLDCAAMRLWRGKMFKWNYDCQAALYLDVWEVATGEDRQDFKHIVQESYAPYQTQLRLVSAEFLEIGRMKYQKALKFYCQCLKTNTWPGYDSDCRTIDGWQLTEPEPWMVQ